MGSGLRTIQGEQTELRGVYRCPLRGLRGCLLSGLRHEHTRRIRFFAAVGARGTFQRVHLSQAPTLFCSPLTSALRSMSGVQSVSDLRQLQCGVVSVWGSGKAADFLAWCCSAEPQAEKYARSSQNPCYTPLVPGFISPLLPLLC